MVVMIYEVMKDIDNYKGALSRFCSLACSAAHRGRRGKSQD